MGLNYKKEFIGWSCLEDPGEPILLTPRWSISKMEATFLQHLFTGKKVLEIGTGLGVSTNYMAETAKWVHTVDIDPWVKTSIVPILRKNVTFYDNIELVNGSFDAAFIDGLHSFSACQKDIVDARKRLKPGAIIAFHDGNMKPVREAILDSGIQCYELVTEGSLVIGWV